MIEQQAVIEIQARIRALGLPEPDADFMVGNTRFDLAWPDRQTAVEVSQRKRPADMPGWTVSYIKPGASVDKIDQVLRGLLS